MLEIVLLSFTILKYFFSVFSTGIVSLKMSSLKFLCFSLSGVLQSLALAQIDVVGKDKIDASVVIFVVILLVGDQIDRLQLVSIARCYHNLIRFSSQKRLVLASFRIELKKISSKTITSC